MKRNAVAVVTDPVPTTSVLKNNIMAYYSKSVDNSSKDALDGAPFRTFAT